MKNALESSLNGYDIYRQIKLVLCVNFDDDTQEMIHESEDDDLLFTNLQLFRKNKDLEKRITELEFTLSLFTKPGKKYKFKKHMCKKAEDDDIIYPQAHDNDNDEDEAEVEAEADDEAEVEAEDDSEDVPIVKTLMIMKR